MASEIFAGGLIFGPFLAAPLTCVILPLARGPSRWGGPAPLAWLVVAGAVGGPLGIAAEMLPGVPKRSPYGGVPDVLRQLMTDGGSFAFTASIAGATCGLLFFLWTRPRRFASADHRTPPTTAADLPAPHPPGR